MVEKNPVVTNDLLLWTVSNGQGFVRYAATLYSVEMAMTRWMVVEMTA